MRLARRNFLRLAAGAVALAATSRIVRAQSNLAQPASKQTARPLADRLADYAAGLRYDDLDAATTERAKAHLIDTLGCGIAAFNEDPVRICRDIVLSTAGGASTIIGTSRRTTPDLATFANGAAFRYYDMNDTYVGRSSAHPSDNIAACLAVGESEWASGEELITAIVLAYEVNCRLIDVFDLTDRGWDTPVFSLPAVALAAGKLMKLPSSKLAQAVNLAINDHVPMGQTRTQTLSDWKGLADAEAGRNAVFAAALARGGITGPAPIFEGRRGFFHLVSGTAEVDVDAFGRLGVLFRIHQCGVKAYPAVIFGQTAIVAGAAVAKEVGDLGRVAAVEIATTSRGYEQTGSEPEKWAPANRETADHSLPYIMARAMFDGDINNDSYSPEKLRDPRILAFMRKITVKADPTFAQRAESAPPTRVTAVLDDGRRITRQVDNIPGFGGQPIGRADIERKFHGNVGERWPRDQIDAILQALWSLDQTKNLPLLLGKLTLQTQR